jgi:tetratricopeptide (TPR) repeat protein
LRYIYLIIINLFSASVFSQTITQTLDFANKLKQESEHASAIKYYQRYLFFQGDGNRSEVQAHLADCYFKEQKYSEAATYYNQAYYSEKNDSLKTELLLTLALCRILNSEFNDALSELYSISKTIHPQQERKKNYFLGIVFWQQQNWEVSKNSFLKCVFNEEQKGAIEKSFAGVEKLRPNPSVAKTLSIFFPGAGQFYAGDIKNGINSLVLNAGLMILYFNILTTFSIFDALITVFPWFQRYYLGGMQKAEKIAFEKNAEKRQARLKNILDTLTLQE